MGHASSVAGLVQSINDFAKAPEHLQHGLWVVTKVLELRVILSELAKQLCDIQVFTDADVGLSTNVPQIPVEGRMNAVNSTRGASRF